jgi:hypothetical protein
MFFFLNKIELYIKTLHCAKITLEQLGDPIEFFGLGWKFWGLATISVEKPKVNEKKMNQREKRDPSSSYV